MYLHKEVFIIESNSTGNDFTAYSLKVKISSTWDKMLYIRQTAEFTETRTELPFTINNAQISN
jgi:hypothetical protein